MVDFYLHTAYTADHLLRPHRPPLRLDAPALGVDVPQLPDTPAAMAWFDAEHANLLAIQQTAALRGRHQAVWQLAWALRIFHTRRGHSHDQLAV